MAATVNGAMTCQCRCRSSVRDNSDDTAFSTMMNSNVSDRERHRHPQDEHQRGHDEETAADAEESGEEADGDPADDDLGGQRGDAVADDDERPGATGSGWLLGALVAPPQHRGRGRQRQDRERHQQHRLGDVAIG